MANRQTLSEEKVIELIKKLDAAAQLRLISKVAEGLSVRTPPTKRLRKPITSYKFCGMWRNREDMKNSTEWVRALREKEERRSYHG